MNWQKIRLALALLALVALSVSGFWGVDQEWRHATGLAAMLSTFMQTVYSVLGLLAVPALLLRSRWSRALLYLWAFTLVLTGATAPIIWGGNGWWACFFAACMMAVAAGLVILFAPLPAPSEAFKRWRWGLAGVFGAAALVVLYVTGENVVSVTAKLAPAALDWKHMEGFCAGTRSGINEKDLTALADQEGYAAQPGDDAKGHYLRIVAPGSTEHYRCEARFKPDGSIASMNFSANAKD